MGAQKGGFRAVWVFNRCPEATFDLIADGLQCEDLNATGVAYTGFLVWVDGFCRG
jgi:hypothetical protein